LFVFGYDYQQFNMHLLRLNFDRMKYEHLDEKLLPEIERILDVVVDPKNRHNFVLRLEYYSYGE
jgi:hypothetical protein